MSSSKKKATPKVSKPTAAPPSAPALFDRVATILDQARANVVRAVNSQMVITYWLIGREIVQEIQGGDERAAYGQRVISDLSNRLRERYGRGFSITNLQNFRLFYLTYSSRVPEIQHSECAKSQVHALETPTAEKSHTGCDQSEPEAIRHIGCAVLADLTEAVERLDAIRAFSPSLGWSHYRALMRVEHRAERLFYEIEAEKAGWDVETLERQIHTFLFARLLKSRDKAGVLALATKGQEVLKPIDAIKNPYVLDFLDLPDSHQLRETKLESAIVSNLQSFLLELGKGFAFIARQKRMTFGDNVFYIDLVFYHCILKCYVLIDLKMGALTHQDIGQMDGYVRMWDEHGKQPEDNPSIGLILCTQKSETLAHYSVLKDSQQLFASRYRLHLPTEEELAAELRREVQAALQISQPEGAVE
jgi:predicted nuclease of restriction endonuclease-like (RecB) superfamily